MLILIPARGGSKGVPGKNIKELGGKPLIQYTIDAAREIVPNKQIVISTDSVQIKAVVENLGLEVPFLRPAELATDIAGTYEVLLHALKFYEQDNPSPEKIILLQPTSPFRNATHIQEALEIYHQGLDMVVSVKETASNPYYTLMEENRLGYLEKSKEGDFTRRQDCPKVWELNGAVYIINAISLKSAPPHKFKKVKKYVMDERSSLDIDTNIDWLIAETIMEKQIK